MAVGDVNGDGRPDLAVANVNSGDVSVLLGNGDGTFQPALTFAAGYAPYSVAVGDFNGDGRPDLATIAGTGVSVLLGNGDGTFQPALTFAAGNSPFSLAVGDFNGDGRPDLAAANSGGNFLSVLLGDGEGTVQGAPTFGAGLGPDSVAVGDVNGDGRPDLVVADLGLNTGYSTVLVLMGNGDGTFQPARDFDVGTYPISVAVGDVNGDGRPDLAVANSGGNTVSVLLGNGDGTFQSALTFTAGSYPDSVAVGDVNGDGRPDLATANYNSNDVSVLINNTAFAPNTLTVSKAGTGSGTVTSSDGAINCGTTCSAVYVSGTPVTLTATPASGSVFSGWSGAGCSGTGSCVVTMNAAQSVTATFIVSGIDLMETAVTNPPSSVGRKGSFSVTDTTMNQGAVAAGASTTRYYLSADTQKSSNDILLNGSRAVPGLASGATSTGTVTVTVPANVQSGTFFLLACSDDLSVVSESNEGNNCTASASQVTVTR